MDKRFYMAHAAMLGANMIFGLNAPISKTILTQGVVNSFSLTLFRMTGAAILFWIISIFTPKEKVSHRDLVLLFFAALFGIVINQVSFLIGLSMTSPIDASIVATMVPILTMFISAIYLKEPITGKKVTGVLTGAAGALLLILTSHNTHTGASGSMSGNLFCLLGCLGFATYLVVFRDLIKRYSPVTLMKWMFLYASVCCIPFGYSNVMDIDISSLSTETYLKIVYVVGGATFLAYLLIPIGQKTLRPTTVSMYNYVQPLIASSAAIIIGLDNFSWAKAVAGGLVFLGVYFVTKSKSRAQMEAEQPK